MDFNRGKLNELYEKAAQKDKIDRQLSMLKQQKGALNRKEMDLRVKMRLEQADVEKLKKFSVSNAWERLMDVLMKRLKKKKPRLWRQHSDMKSFVKKFQILSRT